MKIEYENLSRVNKPYIEEFRRSFEEVLKSGWFILGEKVKDFESAFAEYNNIRFCSGVASGLDALTLSLTALEMEEGSEVIVPANTYIASVISVIQAGHTPVLVEPDIRTYNIDPLKIEGSLTSKTRAVMVVHLYGKPCNMEPIVEICRKHNLFLVEDCAQAHGALYKGRKTGGFGDLSGFSFYPTKNLGCLGDGGAVVTKDPALDEKVRKLRNYGSQKKYYNDYPGINSRLDELQAAFLITKLKHLDDVNRHKRELASIYLGNLKNDFILPVTDPDYFDVYHIFNVRHEKRDMLREYLKKNDIITEVHYPVPPHKQKAFPFLNSKSYPISEEIHYTTLSLPVSAFHTKDDVYRVVEVMNKF